VVSVATQDRLLVPANRSSIMQSRVRSDSSRLAHCIESAHRFDSVLSLRLEFLARATKHQEHPPVIPINASTPKPAAEVCMHDPY